MEEDEWGGETVDQMEGGWWCLALVVVFINKKTKDIKAVPKNNRESLGYTRGAVNL